MSKQTVYLINTLPFFFIRDCPKLYEISIIIEMVNSLTLPSMIQ